jgi:hypothetical protein
MLLVGVNETCKVYTRSTIYKYLCTKLSTDANRKVNVALEIYLVYDDVGGGHLTQNEAGHVMNHVELSFPP